MLPADSRSAAGENTGVCVTLCVTPRPPGDYGSMAATCTRCGQHPAVVTDEELGEVCAHCWTEHARGTVALEPA